MHKLIAYRKFAVVAAVVCILSGLIREVRAHIQSRRETRGWSIGIYAGSSPFRLSPFPGVKNPVLTAGDVTDVRAKYVADPFIIKSNKTWYLFCEVLNKANNQGDIGVAASSDGLRWNYKQIVLDEPFHMSYPYVFKWKDTFYMIPESRQARSVRLYKAVRFPTQWMHVGDLIKGNYVDPSIFQYHGNWWLLVGSHPHSNDGLRLFYAPNLTGPWKEHPKSPVVTNDASKARPGGRVLVLNDRVIRFAQNDVPVYGAQVRAFEITALTTTNYRERELAESPIVKGSGGGWNASRMHTVDLHSLGKDRWIASVDGYR